MFVHQTESKCEYKISYLHNTNDGIFPEKNKTHVIICA